MEGHGVVPAEGEREPWGSRGIPAAAEGRRRPRKRLPFDSGAPQGTPRGTAGECSPGGQPHPSARGLSLIGIRYSLLPGGSLIAGIRRVAATAAEFSRWYRSERELQAFAGRLAVGTGGGKTDLADRIRAALAGTAVPRPAIAPQLTWRPTPRSPRSCRADACSPFAGPRRRPRNTPACSRGLKLRSACGDKRLAARVREMRAFSSKCTNACHCSQRTPATRA
jgi:hypothetical protein